MQMNAILALTSLPFTMMVWSQVPTVTVDLGSPEFWGFEVRSAPLPEIKPVADIFPPKATSGQKALPLTILRSSDGLFYAPVTIGGRQIPFVVDTGSTHVFISKADAKTLGLDHIPNLRSQIKTSTGPGSVRWINAMPLSVANHDLGQLQVGVIEGAKSLLGYTALARLGKVTIEGNRLTIESE